MKKFYSLIAVAMMATAVNAQTVLLEADFSSASAGNNTSTSGSSTAWRGDGFFPTVNRAYQAGGAVRLGASSAVGSISSKALDLSTDGGTFTVEFDVKGWAAVEGQIKVDVTGLESQTYTYSSKMGDSFESVKLTFTGGTANSIITIGTTAKRAFIDNVVVTTVPSSLSVASFGKTKETLVKNTVVTNEVSFLKDAKVQIINLSGQVVKSASVKENQSLNVSELPKGVYIVTGVVDGKAVSQKIIKK